MHQARTRARHRLIGAAVLVAIAIVVFPLVFETEPRRVSVDIPIEIVRQGTVVPRGAAPGSTEKRGTSRGQGADKAAPVAAVEPASRPPEPVSEPVAQASKVITETAADAGREIVKPAPVVAAPRPGLARSETAGEPPRARPAAAPVKAAPPPEIRAAAKPPPPEAPEALRAQSLLEGKDEATKPEGKSDAAATTRYVVQVGAFIDGAAARDTRAKVERLGLKTYPQVGQTPAGARTRVRVGPVATRAEAERMQAKLKAAGLPAVVLTL